MKLNVDTEKGRKIYRYNHYVTSKALLTKDKKDLKNILEKIPGIEVHIQDILDTIAGKKKQEEHLGAVLDILIRPITFYMVKYSEDQNFVKEVLENTIIRYIRDHYKEQIEKEENRKQKNEKK